MNTHTDIFYHKELLKVLAFAMKPKSFLELGLERYPAGLLLAPLCEEVYGVDTDLSKFAERPTNATFFEMTTDQFFAGAAATITKPELVLIDACHERDQIVRDFRGVQSIAADNCLVLLHDTFPQDHSFTHELMCWSAWQVPGKLRVPSVTIPLPPGVTLCRLNPRPWPAEPKRASSWRWWR